MAINFKLPPGFVDRRKPDAAKEGSAPAATSGAHSIEEVLRKAYDRRQPTAPAPNAEQEAKWVHSMVAASQDPWAQDEGTLNVWPHADLRTADACQRVTLVSWAMSEGSSIESAERVLRGCEADVICLRSTSESVVRAMAEKLVMHVAFTSKSGLSILSTHTIAVAEEIPFAWLNEGANDAAQAGGAVLRATVQAGRRKIDFLDAHVGRRAAEVADRLGGVLTQYVRQRTTAGRSVVLACDFLAAGAAANPSGTQLDALGQLLHSGADDVPLEQSRILGSADLNLQRVKPPVEVRRDDAPLVLAEISWR